MSVYTDQPIFDAIAAATQIDTHPDGVPRIVMSASKFIEAFNNHRDRVLCTSLNAAQPLPKGETDPDLDCEAGAPLPGPERGQP